MKKWAKTIVRIGMCVILCAFESARANSFFQDLAQAPFYEYSPEMTVTVLPETGIVSAQEAPDIQLSADRAQFRLGGPNNGEYWFFRFEGKVNRLDSSYRMILAGQEHPIDIDLKTKKVTLDVPVQATKTRLEIIAVRPRGEAMRTSYDLNLSHFPMTGGAESTIRLRSDTRFGLSFGLENWSETTSVGITRNLNFRIPKLAGEWTVYWAQTPHTPSFRMSFFTTIEYTWPQYAYSTGFAYPLAWSTALRVSRYSMGGRVPGVIFSPFLQLERQGIVYAGATSTTVLSETFNVLTPVSSFLFWGQLGFKLEKVLAKRNWELSVLGGRSIFGLAWSDLWSYSLWLGGWQTRLALRTDLTQRLWMEANGQFTWLMGANTIWGLGGALTVGIRL